MHSGYYYLELKKKEYVKPERVAHNMLLKKNKFSYNFFTFIFLEMSKIETIATNKKVNVMKPEMVTGLGLGAGV